MYTKVNMIGSTYLST